MTAPTADSPIVIDDVRIDLLSALREIILAAAADKRRASAGSSNVGGWKSSTDFLSWPDRDSAPTRNGIRYELEHRARAMVDAPILRSWAMVNRRGSYHRWHRHGMACSGIYYVAGQCVPTVFRINGDEVHVLPRDGRLVLFGDLDHSVPMYDGDEPRITIAFDLARVAP